MALLFKPIGLATGLVTRAVSTKVMDRVWQRVDGNPLPDEDVREETLGRIVAANVLQSVIFAATTAVVTRYSMHVYEHLTGSWPGKHLADIEGPVDAAANDPRA